MEERDRLQTEQEDAEAQVKRRGKTWKNARQSAAGSSRLCAIRAGRWCRLKLAQVQLKAHQNELTEPDRVTAQEPAVSSSEDAWRTKQPAAPTAHSPA